MEAQRLQRLRLLMQEAGLEALFITNPYNRRYMTGFTGSAGFVLVTHDKAILYTDFRYRTQAPQQAKYYEVVEHGALITETLLQTLHELGIHRLGIEQNDVSFGAYLAYEKALEGIQLVLTNNFVETLRMQKDDAEIQIMQEAADLADLTFKHILGFLKPGISELDVALEMEFFMRKNGAASSSFNTIIASGERSALPHGVASERKLALNEFVKLDFGAYYKGYCSDMTRTVVLGKPSEKHKRIYEIVLEAQMHALGNIRSGMSGIEGDKLARDIIIKHGYGDQFGHGTGHGLGMEIHENPRLNQQDRTILKPGMIVTVEPGIYLPNFGGVRIEDDIVIMETGIKILTQSTKELIILD